MCIVGGVLRSIYAGMFGPQVVDGEFVAESADDAGTCRIEKQVVYDETAAAFTITNALGALALGDARAGELLRPGHAKQPRGTPVAD